MPRAARWSPGCSTGASNATVLDPPELAEEVADRLELLSERHSSDFEPADVVRTVPPASRSARSNGRSESSIRPERFARLVTLAGMLIESAKGEARLAVADVKDKLHVSEEELRDDIDLLNVVNFGGGTYVLYAELQGDEIEVDAEPYGDNFARPARLLPLEAKALVAAIDLFGDHLPQSGLVSARKKIVGALGHDPSEEGLEIAASGGDDSDVARKVNKAIEGRRVLAIHYYKENEDEFTKREIEPYQLANGPEGWYVASYDRRREDVRHFRLDRIKEAEISKEDFEPRPEVEEIAAIEGTWLSGENVPAAEVARVWVSPGAGTLGARGAHGARGARGRRRRDRGPLREHRLAAARDPQGSRRAGRPRARVRSRGDRARAPGRRGRHAEGRLGRGRPGSSQARCASTTTRARPSFRLT